MQDTQFGRNNCDINSGEVVPSFNRPWPVVIQTHQNLLVRFAWYNS